MSHTPSPAQRAAIEAPLGPTLVVAGPGAGKTFCLIERVGYLIRELGLAPERLLGVTFTNKAAEEIAERLADQLGDAARQVKRGTLHALCAELLRDHGEAVGVGRGFGIADEAYQQLVLARLGAWDKRRFGLLNLFGRRRLQHYQLSDRDEQLFERYRAHLARRNMLDFDDLIARTAELLEDRPETAETIARRWDYVLVDEFQDLNPAQYDIVRRLAAGHRNLFVVGDDEQSIFSWTGADPTVLRRFANDFDAEPIVLDRNRRCSVQIFETARRLLTQNRTLFDKDIAADRASQHEVAAVTFADEHEEAAWIVQDLRADRAASGRAWGDYALLYRTHAIGNHLEATLVDAGIPCRLARGRSLKDDPAIRYVLAALRFAQTPDDPLLLEALAEVRIPNLVGVVRRTVKDSGRDFLRAVADLARGKAKSDPDRAKLWRFFYDIENLRSITRRHTDLMAIVDELLARPVGEYTNVLERRHDELSDPATDPAVRALAADLETALDGRRDVIVGGAGAAPIALRGMLLEAGVTTVTYEGAPGAARRPSGDVDTPGSHAAGALALTSDPLTVFKALQLVHATGLGTPLADFTTFDLETTDLDVDQCEIVEIAAVRVRDGVPMERFHRLVRPARPVDPQAAAVHGYSDADLERAPAFREVWPGFRRFVGTDLVVAHNGFNFDVPVLERMVNALGDLEQNARFADLVFFDSYPLARDLLPGSARLEDVARGFGIDVGRAHHALDDAATLAQVFIRLRGLEEARVRKTSLTNLLDWLAVGLAAAAGSSPTPDTRRPEPPSEAAVLFDQIRIFPLGRYSDVLERYAAERAHLARDDVPAVDELIARLGGRRLMERLRSERTAEQRYPEAVARVRAVVAATRGGALDDHIRRFLERVALSTSDGADVARHRVNLLTLHSTKGLEFQCVYLVGVEDGEFFRGRGDLEIPAAEMEEARRLVYVGMTRAIDRLVLTTVAQRGEWTRGRSRFLEEMNLEPIHPEVVRP